MSPALILTTVRDLLIICGIGFLIWRVYDDGKNAVKVQQLKELQEQITRQNSIANTWFHDAEDANAQLAEQIARIDLEPVVVHDWLRAPAACPQAVLPAATAGTHDAATARGGAVGVAGAAAADDQLRDAAVAAWKRQWEERLAHWRAEHSQWPKP